MEIHEKYMRRCLELAKNGLPQAMPNPSVGAVIVHNNVIIGEGFTSAYGGAHAEVNAIVSVKNQSLLSESTIYVSLEPCSHFGKTPPCCDLILQFQIPNIVIGIADSNEKVNGKGIEKLRKNSKNVIVGVLEKECFEINLRFFTFHSKKRPFVILKWAESADGFIAPENKEEQKPVWITNTYSRQLVHKWRSEEQAILVGSTTVLLDNPKLNVRDWHGKNPIRIVLDKSGKINEKYFIKDDSIKTLILTENVNEISTKNTIFESVIFDATLPFKILDLLYNHGIQSVIIEGGRQTLQMFIDANSWDEARVFIGTNTFEKGTKAPKLNQTVKKRKFILEDELLIFKNYD